jgi:hypothetical protein
VTVCGQIVLPCALDRSFYSRRTQRKSTRERELFWGRMPSILWKMGTFHQPANLLGNRRPRHLTAPRLLLHDWNAWTLSASLTILSNCRKCLKRPISGRSPQVTSLLPIEGMTKSSHIVPGSNFGKGSASAAEPNPRLCGLGRPRARTRTVHEGSGTPRCLSSGGLPSANNSLSRRLRSGRLTERFHINALVTHFQYGQIFCAARHVEDYAVARFRLHQRARQR